MMVEPT